jgi:hypothetical protein
MSDKRSDKSPVRSRTLRWNPDNPEETQGARSEFNAARRAGLVAYRYRERVVKEAEEIRRFDPKAGEILLVPQLVGG